MRLDRLGTRGLARILKKSAAALASLVCALLLQFGCGYHVAGRVSAPSGIQVVAVPALTNRTTTYRIEQRLTEAVVHELLARTKFRVVSNPDEADAVVRGEVNSVGAGGVVLDPVSGRATVILVTIVSHVRLEDRTGKVLYRNDNFVFRDSYEVSTDIPAFFNEQGPMFDRMARDFAQRLVSDMLQNL